MRTSGMLAGVAMLVVLQASAAPPPVAAFGTIPQVANVTLSPNGKLVAWNESKAGQQAVLVYDLDAAKFKARFGIDAEMKLRSVHWSSDSMLLLNVSITRTHERYYTNEWFRTIAADLATGKTKILLMRDDERRYVTGATLLTVRTGKPDTVAMSTWDWLSTRYKETVGTRLAGDRDDSGWVYSAYLVNTRTGAGDLLAYGTQYTDQWFVDESLETIARSEWEPEHKKFTVLVKDGAGWRKIHEQTNGGTLGLIGMSGDGRAILARGSSGQATVKLWSLPLDGSGAKAIVDDPQRDVGNGIYDPLTDALDGVFLSGLTADVVWFDKDAEARQKKLDRVFPSMDVDIMGRSEDYSRAVVRVDSASQPAIYYMVDFAANKADIVGDAYPLLANAKLGPVRTMRYAARDGASIPAYLTLPPGLEAKNLPLVVLPHGGPESRDYYDFDWWAQFLASRGYAVLQPQFRGGIGFGEAHRLAGHGEWGNGVMQHDVTDGVKALIAQGLADPRRVCIVGASYGGYSALAGAAFTPELYACAASVAGVTDLPAMLAFETRGDDGKESDASYYWRDRMGTKNLPEKSPARSAATFRAPVLLIHGADDTVVPIAQSEKMLRELTALKKPATLVTLPGEDHWLSRSDTRIRVLTELETFLATHLGPAAATAANVPPAAATPPTNQD